MTDNYTVTTTSGQFTTGPSTSETIQGTGEVTFTSEGIFDTEGNSGVVRGFTGNYTRGVLDGRSYTSNATFTGGGTIVATWIVRGTMGYLGVSLTSENEQRRSKNSMSRKHSLVAK